MYSNWSYSPETPNLGQIRRVLEWCDLDIWRMTLKNNRAPLLSNIKLNASFYHHMWIRTGFTIWKRLSWVMTCVSLTFDLWPWPFAWTLLWSLVITPGNLMMIQWWEHSQKGVTEGQTDGQTDRWADWTIHRAAWWQLKIYFMIFHGGIHVMPTMCCLECKAGTWKNDFFQERITTGAWWQYSWLTC